MVRHPVSTPDSFAHLALLLSRAERVLAFTGAGVSTASNIPDFRGPDGIWRTRTPVELPEFAQSEAARIEYWSWKLEGHAVFRDAKPNAAHRALVTLERAGKLEALVTQNVDGLHRLAGTAPERLIELHGTNSEAVCMECRVREAVARAMADFEQTGVPPVCTRCGGLMKPGVIMFGEALDPETLRRATAAAGRADLVLALGSSLVVTPAANVPLVALRHKAPYVIVNRGATPHDHLATLTFDADVNELLPAVVAEVCGETRAID